MTNAAEDYDDFLEEGGHRWRKRLILLVVAAALVIGVATALWATFLRDGGTTAAQTQTAKVTLGTITKTISTSATAASQSTANLSFGQSGLVTAVNVKVGQAVKQGDVLAQMESQSLQDAVTKAQVSLTEAQTKLNTTLQGSTPDQLAAADQAVIQAQSNLDKANTALQDLYNPSSDTLSAAQQAVLSAQSQLTKAQQARSALDTNWSDSKDAAQAAVDNARNDLSTAQARLQGAETACPSVTSVPLSSSDRDYLNGIVASGPSSSPSGTPSPTETAGCTPSAASAILTANSAYLTADNTLQTDRDNLSKLGSGPDSNDVSVADANVQSAQLALQSANDKLNALSNPSADDVSQAQQAVDSAQAALTAAQAKRDTTYQGSTPADIQSQQDQITLAQIGLNEAKKNLQNAQIIAPFDGTVAALNVNVGDTVGGGSSSSASSSSSSAIVLNTPNALVLNVSIGESDMPNVKVGQMGTATFDAITGTIFPITIDSIGTNATTTQGVVTYQAKAHIVSGGQGARLGTGRQSGNSAASPTPGASQPTPNASPTPSAQPVAGMNASVTIIVDQAQNVLIAPSSAIQRDGQNEVVNVQNDDGSTGRQTVTTCLTKGTNTEITAVLT
ncbi:MAG: biotin/lipoyl-binding protein [Dehalococcoidia bacterium]